MPEAADLGELGGLSAIKSTAAVLRNQAGGFAYLIPAAIRPKAPDMTARIFQRPKNAMQSGKALSDAWLLEFVPAEAKRPDPLMGWAGSGDMQQQVVLSFASQTEAEAYAAHHSIAARVQATPPKRLKLQAYADNFR